MKILLSVTNDLSIDQRVHRVAMALRGRGWEVELVGRHLPDSKPLAARDYALKRLHLLFKRGKFFYLEYNLRLFLYLVTRRAHTYLANDMDTLPANWLAARLRGKRLVYDTHEYWTEVPELIARPRTRAMWLWLEKRLFPRVDAAMTVNASIAEIYQRLYGLPVLSLRNLPFRRPQWPTRTEPGRILLYQGALNLGRGLELLIDALRELPAEYTLKILGNGPEYANVQAHVAARGLGDRVQMFGFLPFAELPPHTEAAALGFSLEEDRGGSYRLALPNKLFDYIQSGIPVIVSDLPEMAAIVRQYGVGEVLPVEARQPALLAQQIRRICENPAQWQAFRQAAASAAEQLCWEKEEKLLDQIFPPAGNPNL
jgi:glycosyltransferase involved in cell wall biosynthesis